jgi:hypothetical protein
VLRKLRACRCSQRSPPDGRPEVTGTVIGIHLNSDIFPFYFFFDPYFPTFNTEKIDSTQFRVIRSSMNAFLHMQIHLYCSLWRIHKLFSKDYWKYINDLLAFSLFSLEIKPGFFQVP